jgi:predicted nucleic acid-binding protein
MSVVLDTTFLVDLTRGEPAAHAALDELLSSGETLLVPSIVLVEYLAGSSRRDAAAERVRGAADVLPFTEEDALEAARLAAEAFREGRFPGWTDVMIGGFALNRGASAILTRNARHFPEGLARTY